MRSDCKWLMHCKWCGIQLNGINGCGAWYMMRVDHAPLKACENYCPHCTKQFKGKPHAERVINVDLAEPQHRDALLKLR